MQIVRYFNHFGDISPQLWAELDKIRHDTAEEIRAQASATCPVDTGALENSLYVSDETGSDYAMRASESARLRHSGNRPGTPAVIVPEVVKAGAHESVIGSAVVHALYNEFGTARMAARPFLVPAVEAHAPEFFRKIGEALENG